MRSFALFGVKNIGFFEIYGVSAQTRGDGGVNFVRTSFMDGAARMSRNQIYMLIENTRLKC